MTEHAYKMKVFHTLTNIAHYECGKWFAVIILPWFGATSVLDRDSGQWLVS